MRLKCDEPLSNIGFNFNLRRYTKEAAEKAAEKSKAAKAKEAAAKVAAKATGAAAAKVGPDRQCLPRATA